MDCCWACETEYSNLCHSIGVFTKTFETLKVVFTVRVKSYPSNQE